LGILGTGFILDYIFMSEWSAGYLFQILFNFSFCSMKVMENKDSLEDVGILRCDFVFFG
jgi:hypothetical protein